MITAAGNGFSDTYTYDGDGRRVKKSDGTLYWVDDNFHPLSIGTASGLTKDFVFMGDRRIAFVSLASGNSYYYLPDHLGSTAIIASGDGKTIQWDADYYPFGNQRKVFTSLVNNPFQFTGDEYDSDTGFDYSIARFEAGKWSRFLSPDPFMGSMDVSNPQSLNLYSYVLNNPLNMLDPLGLCGESDKVTDNPDGSTDVFGSIPCEPTISMPGDCAMHTNYPEWSQSGDTSVIGCPMPGDQGIANGSARPAMPQKKKSSDSRFSWTITFVKSFFTLAGGPGNVPTCAGEALRSIGNTLNPFTPGVSSAAEVAGPVAQGLAINRGLAQTQAGVDAYVAARGLTVPLRSSVVRTMIAEGAEGAIAAGTKANVAAQTFAIDYAAVKSTVTTSGEARNGQCAAAFPIF
jgi:RHS repeat-associated protein